MMTTDWPVLWYGGAAGGMGTLEKDIHAQIQELQLRQDKIRGSKRDYYNWELSVNRLQLMIDKLYKEQKVAKILES